MPPEMRMVLVSCRRAKQREDSVAGRLHHVTLVAPHRVDRDSECRVDNRARILGIEVAHHFRRILDVREQRRNRLALTVDRRRRIWLFPV